LQAQIFYAFLRGAAKQYGKVWWGTISIWNRHGEKKCSSGTMCTDSGTSLSLLRRLMYSQILYNSLAVCLEWGWTFEDATNPPFNRSLTPIGKIQVAGKRFVEQHGDVGVHMTNVAVMLDFFTGYAPPRHLYAGWDSFYRVWGNLPFGHEEYWAHGILDLLYPGYDGSSYYFNEAGYQVETPHGDGADVLLSDATGYILNRYPVVVVASRLRSARREVRDKLAAYVQSGGTLVLTADASESLGPLLGASVPSMASELCATVPGNSTVHVQLGSGPIAVTEPHGWTVCPLLCVAAGCRTVATVDESGATAAVEVTSGKGMLLLLGSSGVSSEAAVAFPIHFFMNSGMPNPYPLLAHARSLVNAHMAAQTPFTVGAGLSFTTNRISKGKYLVGLANNGLTPLPFKIQANDRFGEITSMTEVPLLDAAGGPLAVADSPFGGYRPSACASGEYACYPGASTSATIAGLDFRLFTANVAEAGDAEEIGTPSMPSAPSQRALPLPELGGGSMQEALLLRPTFFGPSRYWDPPETLSGAQEIFT
jgi:hypothetical protein